MLWYKSWLETRWRFLIGLVLAIGSVCSVVFAYPEVQAILAIDPSTYRATASSAVRLLK